MEIADLTQFRIGPAFALGCGAGEAAGGKERGRKRTMWYMAWRVKRGEECWVLGEREVGRGQVSRQEAGKRAIAAKTKIWCLCVWQGLVWSSLAQLAPMAGRPHAYHTVMR